MASSHSQSVEQLIREQMASGRYSSEDELLIEALQSLADSDAELRAIEEGLQSVDRGDPGVPLDDAFDSLRKKYGLHNEP